MGVIANMALDGSIAQSLLEFGVLETILHLREPFSDVQVLRNSTLALANIAQHSEDNCATLVHHEGLLTMLINCTTRTDDDGVAENVLGTFVLISVQADHHMSLLEVGVVACVLQLCEDADNDAVLEGVARILEQLSACAETCSQLIDEGVPKALLPLCVEEATVPCQLHVCATLANLAKCESKRSDMVNQGVLQPLVALCSRSSLDMVVQLASNALRDLDRDDVSRSMLVQARYVESLVHINTTGG